MVAFLLCPHGRGGGERHRDRNRERQRQRMNEFISSYKAIVPYDYNSTLMTSFILNFLLKDLSPRAAMLGLRPATYGFWEDTTQSIAVGLD